MVNIVIGLGETGRPLYEILKEKYPNTIGYDAKDSDYPFAPEDAILHICIPYNKAFTEIVKAYQEMYKPYITVIHSTVPIGTTDRIDCAVHSPILGRHNRMKFDMLRYLKWVGGTGARTVAEALKNAGFKVRVVETSKETEALKLLCLAKYGASIAFARYCAKVAQEVGFDYTDVLQWDGNINSQIEEGLHRPVITGKPDDKIFGHCVIQNTKLLNEQYPNSMLEEILKYE